MPTYTRQPSTQQIKPIIFGSLHGLGNEASQDIKIPCSSGNPGTKFSAEDSQMSCQREEEGLPGRGALCLFKGWTLHKSSSAVWLGLH